MKKVLLIFLACFFSQLIHATHNRAGEITYVQTGPLSITMTITTYTKASSTGADRDSLEVIWGDGTSQFVQRSNGNGDLLENDVKRNFYIADHVYPGRGTYTISFLDPNRVGGIINLNFPRSEDIQFYLSTTFTLLDVQFQGKNNSAILLQPPIDVACIGERYTHNPNAYDPDGDSLSYELITPLSGLNTPVPNYFFPDQILPGPLNLVFLNPKTGDFIWESPPQAGEYNIAFKINEWRSGVLINTIIRDMQILVRLCNNTPPQLNVEEELCVVAGTKISLPVLATDINTSQKIKVSATGGPMSLTVDKALLIAPSDFSPSPIEARFEWQTTCNHISKEYYQIVFRALDNAFGDTFGLATLKTLRIKVVGPEPKIVQVTPKGINQARLEWELPYQCEAAKNDYFLGFSIWRKEGSKEIEIDTCNLTSLRSYYTRIVFNTTNNDGKVYFYEDNNLQPNTTYCYRVVAQFALKSATGNPFNRVESIPSDEICLQLRRDIPLFTKITVNKTDVTDGHIFIKWTKPLLQDFDTIAVPPPYITEIGRRNAGTGNFTPIAGSRKVIPNFASWSDTTYTEMGLNTVSNGYDYQLKMWYDGNTAYKEIPISGSIFLTATAGDRKNTLNIVGRTSWTNQKYIIYRKDAGGAFTKIGESTTAEYTDLNLVNNTSYCYYAESVGSYNIKNIEDPIINVSQEICSTPIDNEAPCQPLLTVKTICEKESIVEDELFNELNWAKTPGCDLEEVPSSYNIYYKANQDDTYELITNTKFNTYQHLPGENNISGCYAISALDAFGNESEIGNEICIENCPTYVLPNTFTPNGDGGNDLFRPQKNFFIAKVDFEVFDEWGVKVFETTDPAIRWDGKNFNGKDLADGTYYYVGQVYIQTTKGLSVLKKLKGFINILR